VVAAAEFTTEHVPIGQTELYLLKGGRGRPCLVLHGIEGHEGWLAFHAALAERATVYAPSHPGYGHTLAPDWISTIPHQAVFYNWFLQAAGLESVDLIGTGIGGWIAAQMAVMCSARLRTLTLIDAAGVRPHQAEIFDIFIARWPEVIERGFVDAQTSAEYQRIYGSAPVQEYGGIREAGRTMSMRMCFKPYMYDAALPGMLAKIDVPTLIVWGREDRIVPLECASLYQRAIPNASLRIVDNCGHFAHLERPQEVAQLVRESFSYSND
jgi:pimeloyl-ACP methyl ester carboxylesterase